MLHWFPRRLKGTQEKDNEKGFTLIELLIVITLLLHKRLRPSELRPS
jgi:prepilin-type N-terminal cleavage/methylation domain-containing protein